MDDFTPTMGVSVIIPHFDEHAALARTLAALEHQTYPRHLLEVIVVDDGSTVPVASPQNSPLDLTMVHQDDRGFGLSRARNNGVRVAKHDIIVFLDADMMPETELVKTHALWHHVVSDVVTQGLFSRVCCDGLQAETIRNCSGSIRELLDHAPESPWIEGRLERTNDLCRRSDELFRIASGGNLGIGKDFFESLGGFDESFVRYGVEDTEFLYRAQVRGALIVPLRSAFGWHQGGRDVLTHGKRNVLRRQQAKVRDLVAHPAFRDVSPGRSFTVPRYVITVSVTDEPVEEVACCVEHILGDAEYDLVVRIEIRPTRADDISWLRDWLGGDPRVRIGPHRTALDEFPASPYHVDLPPVVGLPRGLLTKLSAELGDAVVMRALRSDGTAIVLTHAWSMHRARRTALRPEDFGDVVEVDADSHWASRTSNALRVFCIRWRRSYFRRGIAGISANVAQVRGPWTAWAFLKWLAKAVGLTIRRRVGGRARDDSGPPEASDGPLGVEIAALGIRARTVFGDCREVRDGVGDEHVDLVLADSHADAGDVGKVPVVVLDENRALAVAAFDPRRHNPIGWSREAELGVASLGPRRLLPPKVKAQVRARVDDLTLLRRCHHAVDVAAFHADVLRRSHALVRLAASGVPVYLADRPAELESLLGRELFGLMTREIRGADSRARELLSIGMRRAALRDHSLQSRARQVCAGVLADPPNPPHVSVLLATKRPGFLPWAIDNVLRQNYPRLELVLALHSEHFSDADIERATSRLAVPVEILRVPTDKPLGTVLNLASAAASGTLLTMMDDDDLYGVDHVWDLVLARGYSSAHVVGKRMEVAYVKVRDQTVLRFGNVSEGYGLRPNGGALLISREDLEAFGGWSRIAAGSDTALLNRVTWEGGSLYRTHSAGCVMVRHGIDHTWQLTDLELIEQTSAQYDGWRPDLAGMEGLPSPTRMESSDDVLDG